MKFENSDKLCEYAAERSRRVCLLSFSRGKDAIGAWLQLQRYFDKIIPVYLDPIPGLQFVADNLRYFEEFFETPILRRIHPSFFRYLDSFVFQAPNHINVIRSLKIKHYDYDDLFARVKRELGLPSQTMTATGVRATDSLVRRMSIKTHGSLNASRHTFFPVYDWNKARLVDEIRASGVKLPVDYVMFGRTLDGLDYRFMQPLKEHLPDDYQRVLQMFPMIECDRVRYEARRKFYES